MSVAGVIMPSVEFPGFLIGVLCGSLLLCIGLALGIWLGRRSDHRDVDREHLQSLLTGLFRWTNGFASDVSSYRESLDQLAREIDPDKVESADGEIVRMLSQIVHANERLQQRLDKAEGALNDQAQEITAYMCEARTDPLTGLPNRRAFDDELMRRLAEWRRSEVALSVVMIDIDHFKGFNDQYGHAAGDSVLADVARVLRDTARESDLVARFGGEEFAMVLPGVSAGEAGQAAERARRAIESAVFAYEAQSLSVTVSCGAAQAGGCESAADLLKRADQALYASKAAGRNTSHLHDQARCLLLTEKRPASDPALASPADRHSGDFAEVCERLRQRLLEVTKGES